MSFDRLADSKKYQSERDQTNERMVRLEADQVKLNKAVLEMKGMLDRVRTLQRFC